MSAGIREAIEAVLAAGGIARIPVYAGELDGDAVRGYTLDLRGFGDCPGAAPAAARGR